MSTSLSKTLFSISECSLFEFITCVVYIHVFEHCFYLWHCPVCMEILIIHIVWIIDVYTHVKIFTLVSQVSDSMMLLVHIFHIYCNICTRHICDIYVDICNIYVTDIYVTYMSVMHIITMSSTSFTFKIQICDIYLTIICPLYFTYNLTYMSHIVFFRKGLHPSNVLLSKDFIVEIHVILQHDPLL